ncbi:RabGAP/TBC [Amylocystis lapponica]|nr:RabGAP/TBC [Amylocystis lapponica]
MTERRTRPDVREIKDAYDYLFNSALGLSKIRDAALGGRLFRAADDAPGVAGRSLAWKLFLVQAEPLQRPADVICVSPLAALRTTRAEYAALLLDKMRAPDGSYEDGLIVPGTTLSPPRTEQPRLNLDRNNPLSLHNENPWTQWFAAMELRKTILQDVERTFPDIGYFRDTEVQAQLTNILFVYAVTHPDIGYRQGMHELLAPLYYAVDFDSIADDNVELSDGAVKEFCSRVWAAADAWALFDALMCGVGRWFEWQESKSTAGPSPFASHVQLSAAPGEGTVKPYVAPIVEACNRIQSTYLRAVDEELWRRMQNAGIEPQIYGIRWLRLLFTREFSMHDSMILWDGLFACDPTFDLAQWICVAMLVRIRNQLMPADYSGQLTYLLHYPQSPQPTSEPSAVPHTSLLLRQALALQMSPSAAMGVSIVHENRNLLDIPVEVPDPPPPPARRRTRAGGQSFSTSEYTARGEGRAGTHMRQQSTPMGLPEMLARGLLERGESLGINKTVMNAVSELKRNLPDLATSLGRLPVAPQTSYAAYPLVDERVPPERAPWEVRRFEVEKEVSQVRALQTRLGDSVGWIVDTLLQDEGSEADAQAIKLRKREALECLAYVRDVLKGTVTEVDDERLVGEEEFKRRKAKVQLEDTAAESASGQRLTPRPPGPAAPPPVEIRPHGAVSRAPSDYFNAHRSAARSPPRSSPLGALAPVARQTPPSSSSSPSPSVLSSNNNATGLAPWNHTRSSFSSSAPPIANLPRPPPRSSTSLRPTPAPPASYAPPTGFPASTLSREASPRPKVQQDPLGALP